MTQIEITRDFYRQWGRGNLEEWLKRYITEDSVLDNPLPAPITFAGNFKGPQGFAQYAKQITETLKIEQFSLDEILADGERVVILGRETSRVIKTGKSYTMSWVHVLTVRDGRVLHMREYNDTEAMSVAFSGAD